MTPKAATLAVGTEVTDGQIIDRNSAWISQKLVRAGVQVIEHRAVADDREEIRRALRELSERTDLLFVTGGLGPTSDDFTRDLLSEVYGRPLEFDPASWRHIEERLGERGIKAKEIQKQQCYFPKGARVLVNPAGTANAFAFEGRLGSKDVKVYALPGPPAEIAAVWEKNLVQEIESLTPESEREELAIFRCLGKGESDVAELTEEAIKGSGLRVGYRAHLPYVEVKLWYKASEKEKAAATLEKVRKALETWIVNRDEEDAADSVLDRLLAGQPVTVVDQATGGILHERILGRIRERRLSDKALPLMIQTVWSSGVLLEMPSAGAFLRIELDEPGGFWRLTLRDGMKSGEGQARTLEVRPPFHYKVVTERARRFVAEKALLLFTGADF